MSLEWTSMLLSSLGVDGSALLWACCGWVWSGHVWSGHVESDLCIVLPFQFGANHLVGEPLGLYGAHTVFFS